MISAGLVWKDQCARLDEKSGPKAKKLIAPVDMHLSYLLLTDSEKFKSGFTPI